MQAATPPVRSASVHHRLLSFSTRIGYHDGVNNAPSNAVRQGKREEQFDVNQVFVTAGIAGSHRGDCQSDYFQLAAKLDRLAISNPVAISNPLVSSTGVGDTFLSATIHGLQ